MNWYQMMGTFAFCSLVNCDGGFEMDDDGRCRGRFCVDRKICRGQVLFSSSSDINECLSNPCLNTIKCENTPGSYRCIEGCEPGYTWAIKHGECRGKIVIDLLFFKCRR